MSHLVSYRRINKCFLLLGFFLLANLFFENAEAYVIEKYDEKVENRFVVSPGKLDIILNPGAKAQKEIVVVNRLGRKAEFFIEKESLMVQGKSHADIGKEWIKPDIENFSLDQGERIKIKVDISIPVDAEVGGYYWGLYIATRGEDTNGKDQVRLVSRVGVNSFITVAGGNIIERGMITKLLTDKFFYKTGPVQITSEFENIGNVHLEPEGEITITNLLGAKVAQIPLKEWVILPNLKKEQVAKWDKKWIMGKYKAELSIHYGAEKDVVKTKTVSFYAFPWHVLLVVLVVLLIIHRITKMLLQRYSVRLSMKPVDDGNPKE